jgi:hypothetical protein
VPHSTNMLFSVMQVVLTVSYLALPGVSAKVFQTFRCEHFDNGSEYLMADYSIDCKSTLHRAFALYSGMMVLVYPLGIPISYFYLLYQVTLTKIGIYGRTCGQRGLEGREHMVESLALYSGGNDGPGLSTRHPHLLLLPPLPGQRRSRQNASSLDQVGVLALLGL